MLDWFRHRCRGRLDLRAYSMYHRIHTSVRRSYWREAHSEMSLGNGQESGRKNKPCNRLVGQSRLRLVSSPDLN